MFEFNVVDSYTVANRVLREFHRTSHGEIQNNFGPLLDCHKVFMWSSSLAGRAHAMTTSGFVVLLILELPRFNVKCFCTFRLEAGIFTPECISNLFETTYIPVSWQPVD